MILYFLIRNDKRNGSVLYLISISAVTNNVVQELVDGRTLELASLNLSTADNFWSNHVLSYPSSKTWQNFREIFGINDARIRVNSEVKKNEKYSQKMETL